MPAAQSCFCLSVKESKDLQAYMPDASHSDMCNHGVIIHGHKLTFLQLFLTHCKYVLNLSRHVRGTVAGAGARQTAVTDGPIITIPDCQLQGQPPNVHGVNSIPFNFLNTEPMLPLDIHFI